MAADLEVDEGDQCYGISGKIFNKLADGYKQVEVQD